MDGSVETSSSSFLRRVFTDPHSAAYGWWHSILMVFIIGSCISFTLESVQDIADRYATAFDWSEWITVGFFTVDAIANIVFAPKPLRYLFSVWGIIDIISVVPSYLMLLNLTAMRATKMIRLLRVARALRVLKLARSAGGPEGVEVETRNPIVANLKIYMIIFFGVFMISSTLMYFVEGSLYAPDALQRGQEALDQATPVGHLPAVFMPTDPISGAEIPPDKRFFTSIPAAMWWCMVTMTTTGYGDLYPVTVGGRIVASFTMLCGLILFAILLNIINKTMMILFFGEKLPD